MAIKGYVEYQRREFCKDIKCPIQVELDRHADGSADYERVRDICKGDCIRTAYEFHHWLNDKKYQIVKPSH